MTDTNAITGGCLCGAVTITANSPADGFGACHCGMCRKWGGGPLMAVNCGTDVAVSGEENVAVFNSSEWAERGFCNKCGSHLFYRLKAGGAHIIPVGLFDDGPDLPFTSQVFIDEKPPNYTFANETKNMTAAEILEMFAP